MSNRYSFPDSLVQLVVNTLSGLPYAQSAQLIGMLQAECQQQDAERAEQQAEAIRAEARKDADAERAEAVRAEVGRQMAAYWQRSSELANMPKAEAIAILKAEFGDINPEAAA